MAIQNELMCALVACHTLPAGLLVHTVGVFSRGRTGVETVSRLDVFRRLRSDLGVRDLWTPCGRVELDLTGRPSLVGGPCDGR